MSEQGGGAERWLGEARQVAAQCWTDPETSSREMDPALAEAVARRIAAWMDTAAGFAHSADRYRQWLVRCGVVLGKDAFIADDGSRQADVLVAKVPELVERQASRGYRLRQALAGIACADTAEQLDAIEGVLNTFPPDGYSLKARAAIAILRETLPDGPEPAPDTSPAVAVNPESGGTGVDLQPVAAVPEPESLPNP